MEREIEILLAEDEPVIREGLVVLLESEGYVVRAAADGDEALKLFGARRPDLVILDVMMPKRNGYMVCTEIRKVDASIPVLFLTAKAGDLDELRGLSLGADDYISKTVSQPVLLARIAAVARRVRMAQDAAASGGTFRAGTWTVDAVSCCLVGADGQRLELSLREVELLRFLVEHPNETLTRDFLVTKLWGLDYEGDENALSVAVCRLREKLGPSGDLIQTVHRKGYRYIDVRS